jgi:hypothetical protein
MVLAETTASEVRKNLERVDPGVSLHTSSHAAVTAVADTMVTKAMPPAA